MSALHIINPSDRETGRYASTNRYVLWFGSHGATYLMCWARSLEDALETCADWLIDNAPGLVMKAWDEEHTTLVREACEDAGLPYPPPDDADLEADGYYAAQEQAEADLTSVDSGNYFLTSYEWGIVFDEGANRADVKRWIADLGERHYSDEPLVRVG